VGGIDGNGGTILSKNEWLEYIGVGSGQGYGRPRWLISGKREMLQLREGMW